MSAETLAAIFTWGTISQWLAIASVFAYDSVRMHARARRQYRVAKDFGNGRVVVARFRRAISRWYIIGSGLALFLGVLATASNLFMEQPPPDTRIVGAVIREGLVLMFFAFWRTKRLNVTLQQKLDERVEGELARTAKDTNTRVRRIEEKIDDPQP